MIQKYLYGIWFVVTLICTAIVLILRYQKTKKWTLSLNEVMDLALAIFGGISGAYLWYQSYVLYDCLYKLIANEGIVAMFLGGLASIWVAFGKVKELIDKP